MTHMQRRLSAAVASVLISVAAGAGLAQQAPPVAKADRGWVDEVKNPVPWFNWGADLRIREKYLNNHISLDNDQSPGHEWHYERFRGRLWATIAPCDNFDFNTRLTWEGRYWHNPDSREGWDSSEIVVDNLNGRVKLPDINTVATVGRQDIILGDGWLVLDGTPLDGSRTIYFDAARATIDFKDAKTKVDLMYIQQYSDSEEWISPISSNDIAVAEQDERGVVLYAANKCLTNTQIDGYFIWKNDERVLANGDDGDTYVFGSRVGHGFNDNWKGRVEGAYQFGNRENPAMFGPGSENVSAFGLNSRLTYHFNDGWKNQLHVGYEFLSGDDPDTAQIEQWNPIWGRWPQWSELYIYSFAAETRIAEVTNLHRLNLGWLGSPTAKMDLLANYHLLFAAENTFEDRGGFDSGDLRGHLFTAMMRYKFNRHLAGHLLGEYFMPGSYYSDDRQDDAAFLRAELFMTF